MSKKDGPSYLIAMFRRAAAPLALTVMTGCATTVQKFDPEYCMEWTESEAQLLVTKINTRSESVYQNACVQGRAGAQVALIGNNGKQLHPVSASIGKEFLTTVSKKADEERRLKNEKSAQNFPMGEDSIQAPKREDGPTFYEKVRTYFNYYLGLSGFSETEIERDAKLDLPKNETLARPSLLKIPDGCTKKANNAGYDCK